MSIIAKEIDGKIVLMGSGLPDGVLVLPKPNKNWRHISPKNINSNRCYGDDKHCFEYENLYGEICIEVFTPSRFFLRKENYSCEIEIFMRNTSKYTFIPIELGNPAFAMALNWMKEMVEISNKAMAEVGE